MKVIFSQKFKKEMAIVQPGEYLVSDNLIIHTLLGTCVSVVLYSDRYKIGGLNHYMLPSTASKGAENSGRYGVYAMELLINEFMNRGISRNQLVAKVFGGGKVLDNISEGDNRPHVGTRNIEFVKDFLHQENIPIVSQDLGGIGGRKIYFFPWTGKVLVSHIRKTQGLLEKEDKYKDTIRNVQNESRIIFFDEPGGNNA